MLDFPDACETLWNINSGVRMTCQGCSPNPGIGLLLPIAGGRSKLCGTNKLDWFMGKNWQMNQERDDDWRIGLKRNREK